MLPARPPESHKGTFGSLVIIGGQISKDTIMLGSAAFVAKAALRSGVGLVYFANKKQVMIELVKMVPQAMGQNLDNIKKCDAIVFGPGLGKSPGNIKTFKKVLSLNLPTVIDADGLNILADNPQLLGDLHDKCICTPHPGEFSRLATVYGAKTAEQLSRKLGCCVVLKGNNTFITDGTITKSNKVDNPALSTGGTGDVLAGLIGGLLAQHYGELSIFEIALLGVVIHSKAGLAWSEKHGLGGLIIDELIDLMPQTIKGFRASS